MDIAAAQSAGDAHYPPGLWPAQRFHPHLPYQREDATLFYTALILFTLQKAADELLPADRALLTRMQARAAAVPRLFRNRDGYATYNFWQTRPSRHMPNGWLTHRLRHFQIPDDLDDTALALLAWPHARAEATAARARLLGHANGTYRRARPWLRHYRHWPTYSTWCGKHMGVDFDVCALSNFRLAVHTYHLPPVAEDDGAVAFVCSVIRRREHLTAPYYVAPYYARPALILYHVVRLATAPGFAELDDLRPQLVADLRGLLATARHPLERALLATSLLRLGQSPPQIKPPTPGQWRDFWFFQAGQLSAFEGRIWQRMAPYPVFHLKYRCLAYHQALWLEYQMLAESIR